ncbi:MAG: hypothetical protein ACHREM_02855 [Polyangiales bacterium]
MGRGARWSKAAFGGVGVCCLIAAGACGKSSPSTSSTDVIIVDNAHVMTGSSVDDAVIGATTVTFQASLHPELLNLKPGDILVGDKSQAASTQNHTGFLRKVVDVKASGSTIVVDTSVAYLTDVVRQGSFHATIQLPDTVPATTSALSGKSLPSPKLSPKGGGTSIKLLDYSGTKLLDESGSATVGTAGHTVAYQLHATVTTGTLEFTPSFDIGADIVPDLLNPIGSIHGAHVIGTGTLNADAEFDVGLKITSSVTGDDIAALIASKITKSTSTTLVNYPIVDLGSLSLGPIPLPVSATFTTTLTCQAQFGTDLNVTGGAKASGSITAGFTYDGDSKTFTPQFSHSESFTQIGPNWTIDGDLYFHCVVEPKIAVNLFDMASGEIWADPYFTVEADASCSAATLTGDVHGDAYAGVSATAHGKLDVLGLFKWEKECELFDLESPHLPFSGSVPLPKGSTCVTAPAHPSVATHDTPAASCFDGSSSGGDAGPGSDGGGEACVQTGEPVPTGWTCAASKWDDCTCDCGCGVKDIDCGSGAACSGCDHDTCTIGTALGSSCTKDGQGGACIASICANDDYCCTSTWSASCVQHIIDGDYACTKNACSDAGP